MKIAIFGKSFDENSLPYVQNLFEILNGHGAKLVVYGNFLPYLKERIKLPDNIELFNDSVALIQSKPDFMFSLGGDGTILSAVTFIRNSGIPVLGINTGRLGFLSNVSKEDLKEAIAAIWTGNFNIDKRNLLKIKTEAGLFGELNFALNEMTVHKKDSSSMITIHAYANNEYLNSYWADGLIVSTPTGSTAYSLSCGGPIIAPNSQNIIITPIAPHNLNVRPIVLSDDTPLKLVLEGRSNEFLISADSRSETIDAQSEIIVKKCDFQINMVELENRTFFRTIRHKLMWGIDQRN